MPTQDEPLQTVADDEIEEISPEFILAEAEPAQVAAPKAALPPGPRPEARPEPRPQPAPAPAPKEPPPPAAQAAPPAAQQVVSRRSAFPLVVALVFLVAGFGGGFFAGRLWERQGAGTVAVAPPLKTPAPEGAPTDEPAAEPKRAPKPTRRTGAARTARAAGSAIEGKGRLQLTAPPEAEVFLDGRRVGRGSMRLDVAPGAHRIEVKVGKSRVSERFEVSPNETWTYEVTPSK